MSDTTVSLVIDPESMAVNLNASTDPMEFQWLDGKILQPQMYQYLSANDVNVYADYLGLGASMWNLGESDSCTTAKMVYL